MRTGVLLLLLTLSHHVVSDINLVENMNSLQASTLNALEATNAENGLREGEWTAIAMTIMVVILGGISIAASFGVHNRIKEQYTKSFETERTFTIMIAGPVTTEVFQEISQRLSNSVKKEKFTYDVYIASDSLRCHGQNKHWADQCQALGCSDVDLCQDQFPNGYNQHQTDLDFYKAGGQTSTSPSERLLDLLAGHDDVRTIRLYPSELVTNKNIRDVFQAFSASVEKENPISIGAVHYKHWSSRTLTKEAVPVEDMPMFFDVVGRGDGAMAHLTLPCVPVVKGIVARGSMETVKKNIQEKEQLVQRTKSASKLKEAEADLDKLKKQLAQSMFNEYEIRPVEKKDEGVLDELKEAVDTLKNKEPTKRAPFDPRVASHKSAKKRRDEAKGTKLEVCAPSSEAEYVKWLKGFKEQLMDLVTPKDLEELSRRSRRFQLGKNNGQVLVVTHSLGPSATIATEYLMRKVELRDTDRIMVVGHPTSYDAKVKGFRLLEALKDKHDLAYPKEDKEDRPAPSFTSDVDWVAMYSRTKAWQTLGLVDYVVTSNGAVRPSLKPFSEVKDKFNLDAVVNLEATMKKKTRMVDVVGVTPEKAWAQYRQAVDESAMNEDETRKQLALVVHLHQTLVSKYMPEADKKDTHPVCKMVVSGGYSTHAAIPPLALPTEVKRGPESRPMYITEMFVDDALKANEDSFQFVHCPGHPRAKEAPRRFGHLAERLKQGKELREASKILTEVDPPINPVKGVEGKNVLSVTIANISPLTLELGDKHVTDQAEPEFADIAAVTGKASKQLGVKLTGKAALPEGSVSYKLMFGSMYVATLGLTFDGSSNLLAFLGAVRGGDKPWVGKTATVKDKLGARTGPFTFDLVTSSDEPKSLKLRTDTHVINVAIARKLVKGKDNRDIRVVVTAHKV
jgi:hypothetical protein